MNGAVRRSVTLGSLIRTFQRSASSGFIRGGAFSSEPASSPCSASFSPEHRDVVGLEPAPEPLRDRVGERGMIALAVDRLQQRVHQRPELDHLPVGAAHERRAFLVARPADGAEQLEAVDPRERGVVVGRRGSGGPVYSRAHTGPLAVLLLVDGRVLLGRRVGFDVVQVLARC